LVPSPHQPSHKATAGKREGENKEVDYFRLAMTALFPHFSSSPPLPRPSQLNINYIASLLAYRENPAKMKMGSGNMMLNDGVKVHY
jgi:hypothetical protein